MKNVLLKCLHKNCPRHIKIPFDSSMPEGTKTILSDCPWHQENGGFSQEFYLDKNGTEIGINSSLSCTDVVSPWL
jgi:hypothetical protein